MLGKGLESLIPPDGSGEANPLKDQTEYQQPATEPPQPAEVYNPEHGSAVQSSHTGREAEQNKEPQLLEAAETASADENISGHVFQIEVEKIRPNPQQPRRDFDEVSLRELANSIREFGVLQPLVVSKVERESERGWSVTYELVAGERRLLASKMAGLGTVPVIVRSEPASHEKLELAVIENIQRTDLNPIELAKAIARLQDEFGLTQREIATRLGKSRESVANTVRLLGLPTEIQEAVAGRRVSESHARLLLSVDDVAMREKIFRDIVAENLNVREADARIRGANREGNAKPGRGAVDPEIAMLKDKLEEFLGTKVDLQGRGKSGKIAISFYSPEELESIVDKVTKQNDNQFPLPPLEPLA